MAWGLGTEAPTRAEMGKNTQQHRDLLRTLGTRLPPEAPAAAGTQTHLSQRSQNALSALICAQIVFGEAAQQRVLDAVVTEVLKRAAEADDE